MLVWRYPTERTKPQIVLKRLQPAEGEGETEIVRAKFVLGADGKWCHSPILSTEPKFRRCPFVGP